MLELKSIALAPQPQIHHSHHHHDHHAHLDSAKVLGEQTNLALPAEEIPTPSTSSSATSLVPSAPAVTLDVSAAITVVPEGLTAIKVPEPLAPKERERHRWAAGQFVKPGESIITAKKIAMPKEEMSVVVSTSWQPKAKEVLTQPTEAALTQVPSAMSQEAVLPAMPELEPPPTVSVVADTVSAMDAPSTLIDITQPVKHFEAKQVLSVKPIHSGNSKVNIAAAKQVMRGLKTSDISLGVRESS